MKINFIQRINVVEELKGVVWQSRAWLQSKSRLRGFGSAAHEVWDGFGRGKSTRPYLLRLVLLDFTLAYRGGALRPNNGSHIIAFIAQ